MKQDIRIKIIPFDSKDYFRSLELREKILRKPLGLKLSEEDLLLENKDIHFGCFTSNDRIVGTVVLSLKDNGIVRMRQVSVDEEFQRQGIGREMVRFVENYCKEEGFTGIILSSRKMAVGFYTRLGYKIDSDEYTDGRTKVPHYLMKKAV